MIIAQEQFLAIVQSLPLSTLKMQMGRLRLKFLISDIALLLNLLNMAQTQKLCLKTVWQGRNSELGTYQNFCKNLETVAKLMPLVMSKFNAIHGIQPSKLMNIIDTSLIPVKAAQSIRSKDYAKNDVTLRKVDGVPHHVCGVKLFAVLNRQGFICKTLVLPINTADIDATKNPYYYGLTPGILLADKGFNSALARQRLKSCGIKLLSPFKVNQKQQLTDKEKRFYKRRWRIETVFQKLKAQYGHFKLGTSSRYTKIKQKAALLLAVLNFNASLL